MFSSFLHQFTRRHVVYLHALSSLLHPSVFRNRRLRRKKLCRMRESSIRVCLPAIPIKGSIVLTIRELRRPCARSCVFPRNWTGSILRGDSGISVPLFLRLYRTSYIHIYIYTYIYKSSYIGQTTHRKILFLLDVSQECMEELKWISYYHLIFI